MCKIEADFRGQLPWWQRYPASLLQTVSFFRRSPADDSVVTFLEIKDKPEKQTLAAS